MRLRQRGSQSLYLSEFSRSRSLLLAYEVDSRVRQARKQFSVHLLTRLELRVAQIVDADAQHVLSLQPEGDRGRVFLC